MPLESDSQIPGTVLPTAREILGNLKDGSSPLDFIRNNLNTPPLSPPIEPQSVIKEVETKREEQISSEITTPEKVEAPETTDIKYDINPEIPKSDIKTDATEPETKQEEPEPAPNSKEENFKKLRQKLHETNTIIKDKEDKLKSLEEKVKKYETGEELPDVLKAKEERIQELEKYERLHALKLSPAYKERFIKPLNVLKERLSDIAADYEIPSNVLEQALNITNRRELNSFLAEHFDEVGALEVKQVISDAQKLNFEAKEAEKEPAKALQALESDFENISQQRRLRANQSIVETSKEAWIDSLIDIRKEGRIQELIEKESDPEYNEKFVRPLLTAASSEYGKLVTMLAKNGLETLPKDVAYALARMVHLAHASAVSIDEREEAKREVREIEQNTQRTTRYLRPQVGSSGISGSGGPSPQPDSPTAAADLILNNVLSRRR